jgi:hypothetical protein
MRSSVPFPVAVSSRAPVTSICKPIHKEHSSLWALLRVHFLGHGQVPY